MLDLNNKTILITGCSSGIGLELLKSLLNYDLHIIMAVRNLEKAIAIKNELNYENIEIVKLDLNTRQSVLEFVDKIKEKDIDIFVNNAGVYHLDKSINQDGQERTMATNYLNVFLMNELLIPYFKTLNHKVQILFTNSIVYKHGKLNYQDFYMLNHYKKMQVYANSKLAITMYFSYLVNKYEDSNLKICLVHPGIVYTPIIDKGYKKRWFVRLAKGFMKITFNSISNAKDVDLFALDDKIFHGSYIGPRFLNYRGKPKIIKLRKFSYQDVEKLVEFSKEETKLKENNNE